MDINLVKYFLVNNGPNILRKSLRNCHVKGVDSIMFDDTPGARIRMFVTTKDHELWKPGQIAIHSHHCDLRLEGIIGEFDNILCELNYHLIPYGFKQFTYQSKILTGKSGFIKTGENYSIRQFFSPMHRRSVSDMPAEQLHTVQVEQGKIAAWMVYEGQENPNYESICYSYNDLENFDSSKLYQLMDWNYLYKTLRVVWPDLNFT